MAKYKVTRNFVFKGKQYDAETEIDIKAEEAASINALSKSDFPDRDELLVSVSTSKDQKADK